MLLSKTGKKIALMKDTAEKQKEAIKAKAKELTATEAQKLDYIIQLLEELKGGI